MILELCQDAVNLVKINFDVGRDAVLILPNYEVIYCTQSNRSHCHLTKMTNIMSARVNISVYSNAAILLSSGFSNTGLENVIYCSTTTDTGLIQNFTAVSSGSCIPYYIEDIYQV